MSRLTKQRSKKAGLPPGSLVHIGDKKRDTVSLRLFEFNEHKLDERELELSDFRKSLSVPSTTVKWINIDGIHRVDILEEIGKAFDLHDLVLEDILNTAQRPKIEDYGGYVYIVAKMLYLDEATGETVPEQVSIVLGNHFVLSFQEEGRDVFDTVRVRLRNQAGRIRKQGADYLAYSLLDAIVDNYFIVLEKIGDRLEQAEDNLLVTANGDTLRSIQGLKREMLFLHKAVWPLREVLGSLERRESALIQESTEIYLRDVYDHIIELMDTIETFRDMLSGMLDIYLSSASNRMNEIMKVLTVISTFFIPLTFIAGVYGMNFSYMPELKWRWGYPLSLILMSVIAFLMMYYFKKKKWF